MFFAGIAFIVAALIQDKIDVNLTVVPDRMTETTVRFINTASCPILIPANPALKINEDYLLPIGQATDDTKEVLLTPGKTTFELKCEGGSAQPFEVTTQGETAHDIIIQSMGGSLEIFATGHPTRKSDTGAAQLGVYNLANIDVTIEVQSLNSKNKVEYIENNEERPPTEIPAFDPSASIRHVALADLKGDVGEYTLTLKVGENIIQEVDVTMGTGGLYTIMAWIEDGESDPQMNFYEDIYLNDVSLFWMIPQYFIITVGEVFLSVTGLEFAYSQAPASMKSVLQSFWLFTVSIGNIIVLIVAETALIPSQRDEYYLFAGLIFAAGIIFIFLAMWYTYVDEDEFADEGADGNGSDVTAPSPSSEKKAEYDNSAYKRDYDTDTKM